VISEVHPKTGNWRDDWQTDHKTLAVVRQFAPIALDVATAPSNPTGAQTFFTAADDGLAQRWSVDGLNFCNPPYSETGKWLRKAESEAKRGAESIVLIPSRTGARYFAPAWRSAAMCFVTGRITFLNADTGLPQVDGQGRPMPARFESVILYWGQRRARFRLFFNQLGEVIYPLRGGARR